MSKKDNGIKGLLKHSREEREKELSEKEEEKGLSSVVGSSVQSLNEKLHEQRSSVTPVEEESYEEREKKEILAYEEAAHAGENKLDKDMLGLPIVTIKTVLDLEHAVEDSEFGVIRTAIVDHKGDEVIVGIWPGIDYSTLIEGDKAIYDDKEDGTNMIIHPIDTVTPSNIPVVSFKEIGDLEEQIEDIKYLLKIFDPKARKEAQKLNRKMRNGCLLFGPPGTGKTMLAEAAANYANVPFFNINTPELFDSHLGGTVKNLKAHDTAARKYAKRHGGAILYFDEITRIAAQRNYGTGGADSEVSAVTEELQALMNGDHYLNPDEGIILYMASTNLQNVFDSAVLRRFKKHIKVPAPTREGREEILSKKIELVKYDEHVHIPMIINKLDDIKSSATGADIEIIVEDAKVYAEMDRRDYLNGVDFDKALDYFSQRVDVLLAREKQHATH